jgi:NAD(P)-dependent dehydrogenase (short-subunit alcohol dehydrogenase family)
MFQHAHPLGPLAGLVNNAGIAGKNARVDEQEADDLSRLMPINVIGPMLCAKHAVQAMSTRQGGAGGTSRVRPTPAGPWRHPMRSRRWTRPLKAL